MQEIEILPMRLDRLRDLLLHCSCRHDARNRQVRSIGNINEAVTEVVTRHVPARHVFDSEPVPAAV